MHVRPSMVFGLVAVILGIQFISLGLLGELLVSSTFNLDIFSAGDEIEKQKQNLNLPSDSSINNNSA